MVADSVQSVHIKIASGYDEGEEGIMSDLTIEIKEAQDRLHELLARVAEGSEIILTDGDRPFARISPILSPTAPRISDLHPGAFQPSDDFDSPLPDEFWLGEE
jgi:antitoxin (DNA-binding transcriptional repressor) of toxin-antitoxin stability system